MGYVGKLTEGHVATEINLKRIKICRNMGM